MARLSDDMRAGGPAVEEAGQKIGMPADGGPITVPSDFISQSDIIRDGQDLILKTADGKAVVIEGYFSADPAPVIQSSSGNALTPELVRAFAHGEGPAQYAGNSTANDESPVGVVREVHGHCTVRHKDGTTENIIVGTPIHEGDVVETDGGEGAVNIMFRDNSTFAVSHNAKLTIDEYVFDPNSDAGASNFSMLRGMFVYTSGQIGHKDPDDVHIHTPAGSIGIRGTVIAGDVDSGQITVTEGAIVLTSNSGEQVTLAGQLQTAQFGADGHITMMDTPTAGDLSAQFSSLSTVDPGFFSGLGGTGSDGGTQDAAPTTPDKPADDQHGAIDTGAPGSVIGSNDIFSDDGGIFVAGAGGGTVFTTSPPLTGGGSTGGIADSGTIADGSAGAGTAGGTAGSGTGTGTGTGTVGTTFADQVPVAGTDNLGTTDQNTPILAATNVLINDVDADPMDMLSVTPFTNLAGSAGGAFTMDGAGNVTFDPTAGTPMAYLGQGASAVTSVNYILTDSFGAQTLGTISVTVTGINDAPTMAATAVMSLNENATAVATVLAYDADLGDTLSYALSGTDAALFSIDATGTITALAGHDFEGGPTVFNFIVTATDANLLSAAQSVTVNLVDLNEAPSVTSGTMNIAENSAASTSVGTPGYTEQDTTAPNNTLTWSILSGNTGGAFAINSSTGEITVAGALNFETLSTYNLTVRAADGGGQSSTAVITINITNVPEAPVITASSLTVTQGASIVLTAAMLGATDVDTANGMLVFQITSNVANGQLYLNGGAIGISQTFTMADIIAGNVKYLNNGYVNATDSLGFDLQDGANTVSGTLAIAINAVAPLNLNTIGSAQGYWIRDNNGQKFAGSIASGDANNDGLDDLIFVKAADGSANGQFFKQLGTTGTPSNLSVPTDLFSHSAGFSGGSVVSNLVVSYVGKFGPSGNEYIVIGAPQADNTGMPVTGNISLIDTSTGNSVETINGLTLSGGQFGASVAGVGDVNGDGYMDILIGAPAQQPGGNANAGSAFIMLGGTIVATLNVGALTNSVDGGSANERLGTDVAGAGDFNNDGYADFMVSDPGTGFVNLYLGMAGPSLAPNLSAPVTINVGTGPASFPLAGLGDFNGDGIADVAVLNTALSSGTAGIFFGSSTPGAMTLAGADVRIDLTGTGVISAIGSVGDFNGDGRADFGIVTHDAANTVADIYVLFGSNTLGGTLTEADLNNVHMAYHMQYTLGGMSPAKISIGDAGDLNGDGFHDVVIGLPGLDTGGTAALDGAAIVVYGKVSGFGEIVTDGSPADADAIAQQIQASGANQSLVGTAANDLLSDNALATFSMTGGAGNDRFFIGNNGIVHVDGGSGVDQIELSTPAMTMDFSLLGTRALLGIEKISMDATGQTMTLSLGQVFELMQHSDDSGNLKIFEAGTGTNTTVLNINGTGGSLAAAGFTANGTTGPILENDGNTHVYAVYDHGANQHLLIDTNINAVNVT